MNQEKQSQYSKQIPLENQPVIYMLPQKSIDEQEISVGQIILPLIKYKVQILLVVIVSIFLAIVVSKLFGKTEYIGKIVYKYVIPAEKKETTDTKKVENIRTEFFPEQQFFNPNELSTASPLLNQYWIIPNTSSGLLLKQYIEDSSLIKFNKSSSNKNLNELIVSTDNPKKTYNVLLALFKYFLNRNASIIEEKNYLELRKQARIKESLINSLNFAINNINRIRLIKMKDKNFIISQDLNKSIILIEFGSSIKRAIKIDGIENLSKYWDKAIITAINSTSSSDKYLKKSFSSLINHQNAMYSLMLKKRVYEKAIESIDQGKFSKRHYKIGDIDTKSASFYESKIQKLANEISNIDSQINKARMSIENYLNNIRIAQYYTLQTLNAPVNVWIESKSLGVNKANQVNILDKNNSSQDQNRILEEKIEKVSLPYIDDFIDKFEDINNSILAFQVETSVYKKGYIIPFELIEPPSYETIERHFLLQFTNVKRKEKSEKNIEPSDIKPILFSNKILLFSISIACIIAILSVYTRVLIVRLRNENETSKFVSDLFRAIKFWKL